jgi:hypothetical protein
MASEKPGHAPGFFVCEKRRKHFGYYQSASPISPIIRGLALLAAQHVGFARNHAVTTLIGGRTGWLTSTGYQVPFHFWDFWDGTDP